MTEEEIINKINIWSEDRLKYPDIIGIGECLVEYQYELDNSTDKNIPPWISLEHYKDLLISRISELKTLYDYALKHNINVVL